MRISDWSSDVCSSDLNRDDACPSQSKVVLKSDPAAFHLSRTASPAQFRHKLRAFRQPARPHRMPLREQSTRRVRDALPPLGVAAARAEPAGPPSCTPPHPLPTPKPTLHDPTTHH